MKTFTDNEGNERPLPREKILSIMSPSENIEDAVILAQVTFPAGMYNLNYEATTWEISKWLYDSRGFSIPAAIFAADEGYKKHKERTGQK